MIRFTTITDVVEQAVIPALGEEADFFDVEAIARETHQHRVDVDEDGNELVTSAGFEQTVDEEEFWLAVARHQHTFTAEIPEATDTIVIQHAGQDSDFVVLGGTRILLAEIDIPYTEEWEPDVLDEALRAAGWLRIAEWDRRRPWIRTTVTPATPA